MALGKHCEENEKTSHRPREICTNHTFDKGFVSKIYKELVKEQGLNF